MKPETVVKSVCIIGVATAAACYVAAIFLPLPARAAETKPQGMMIVSVDTYGGEWISGRGDTCEDAALNAEYPKDLVSVECVPADSE